MKDTGPIPAGQVEKVSRLAAPPPDSFTNSTEFVVFTDGCACNCPFTGDPCRYYICNTSCTCQLINAGTTTSCDDGKPCTYNDHCDGVGSCTSNNANACVGDQCNSSQCDGRGGCLNTPLNGATCNDGNACTYSDRCDSTGVCRPGGTVTCTSDTCATRSCNGTSSCNVTPRTGAACNDNNPCTYGETCTASATCGVGTAITCTSDACNTRTCQGTATCAVAPRTGASCDDQNPCTYGDSCNAQGACMTGTPITCTSDVCNTRSCNGTATCTVTPLPGTACNDGNACTYGEVCSSQGSCGGGSTVTCDTDSCNVRQCNGTSTCVVTPRTGNPCDDSQACTFADVCSASGACAGTPLTCTSDENADRSCNGSATCTVVPKPGAACDDSNPCTKGDVRQSDGSCRGMAYTCDVGDCLVSSACDGRGGCTQVAKPDGTECDADKSLCTPNDACKGGACVPDPAPVRCVERDCNTVACNPGTGNCDYTATSGGPCGVSGCFTAGMCNAGQCSGTPKDCANFNGPCTTGLCDAATGACMAAPKLNGTDCSAGGLCTAAAACAFGVCELTSMTCPAATAPCKVAACNPIDGKCKEAMRPPGAPCDAKNGCVSNGMCDEAGNCRGTPALNGSPCTLAGGKVGECVVGNCVASGSGGTGNQDAGAGGDGGGVTDARDAGGDANGLKGTKRGCSMGGSGDVGPAWALLLVAAVLLARRRRR